MSDHNQDEPHDWAKLSFGEFLRRTPTGLLVVVTLSLLSAGWVAGTYFAGKVVPNDLRTNQTSQHSPPDTFFIDESEERRGTPAECLIKAREYFIKRDGVPTVLEEPYQLNAYLDHFFCFINCNGKILSVVCNGPTALASRGLTQSLVSEINRRP